MLVMMPVVAPALFTSSKKINHESSSSLTFELDKEYSTVKK